MYINAYFLTIIFFVHFTLVDTCTHCELDESYFLEMMTSSCWQDRVENINLSETLIINLYMSGQISWCVLRVLWVPFIRSECNTTTKSLFTHDCLTSCVNTMSHLWCVFYVPVHEYVVSTGVFCCFCKIKGTCPLKMHDVLLLA